jgi:hypothetical protein
VSGNGGKKFKLVENGNGFVSAFVVFFGIYADHDTFFDIDGWNGKATVNGK